MKTISLESISLEAAAEIARHALVHARSKNMAPLAVAVLDPRGSLKAFLAEDGTSLLRFDIAFGKAWGSLGMGFGGRKLTERNVKAPDFIHALQTMSAGKVVPVPGGVLIRNAQGALVGAVGISGETSDNDELCAVHGVQAVGLVADAQ
jgi:uncharacterized protein GlcG (DUF336 family)